ncbi:MAG: PIN domain-containing protein [Actinomycetota bacterium]|nr:PIN domain-containing protein [Actinomycetota bacterium]
MRRVLADTNVLFPFSVMDLLLALSEDGLHEVIWTEALLDEWEEVIVREQRRTRETAASVTAAIREFFPDAEVERSEYQHLVSEMTGPDATDHQHMAAAVARRPCTILTKNAPDFPPEPLAAHGVRVADPDDYLSELADEWPDEVAAAVVRLASEKQRPARSPHDLADALERAGVPRFAERLRKLLAER